MKKLPIILALACLPSIAQTQSDTLPDPEAFFSALIVNDIDSSISWYSRILGFKVSSRNESQEMGYKQSNLKRGNVLLELIELRSAISPEEVVPNYSKKTLMRGIFKTGFLVSDFEKWVSHLKESKVDFHGNVVTDDLTGKKMAIIMDPDGNRLQFFEK